MEYFLLIRNLKRSSPFVSSQNTFTTFLCETFRFGGWWWAFPSGSCSMNIQLSLCPQVRRGKCGIIGSSIMRSLRLWHCYTLRVITFRSCRNIGLCYVFCQFWRMRSSKITRELTEWINYSLNTFPFNSCLHLHEYLATAPIWIEYFSAVTNYSKQIQISQIIPNKSSICQPVNHAWHLTRHV